MILDPILFATVVGCIGMFLSEVKLFNKRYSR